MNCAIDTNTYFFGKQTQKEAYSLILYAREVPQLLHSGPLYE